MTHAVEQYEYPTPVPTWALWLFVLVCGAMSAFGFWFFLFKALPERDGFQVVEGRLVADSVQVQKKRLSFRVEGYERTLMFSEPKERIPALAEQLGTARRLQVRVDPWSRNPKRATVMELAAVGPDGGAETLFSFEERRAWEVYNNRLGGGIGLFFGAFMLALLLIARDRKPQPSTLPATGAITQHMYVSLPKTLVIFVLCGCMTALFAWGVSQFRTEPLLAVLSVPMGLFFVVVTALLTPWLIPWRPQLVVDERGIIDGQLGFGRIPWDRIDSLQIRYEGGLDYLCVDVREEDELLARSSWLARFCGWANRLNDFPSVSVCLFPLGTTTAEVVQIIESHGQEIG